MNVWTHRVCSCLALLLLCGHILLAQAPRPVIDVLVQSPTDTEADLQVICLFRSSPTAVLNGALAETNEKTHGLLSEIRQPGRFHGALGETLLVLVPQGTLKAKRLLFIGLGDSRAFTPNRMRLVGTVLLREATHLRASHPYFAPTIKDGGNDRYTTGEISEQVVTGFLEAYATEQQLAERGESLDEPPSQLTYLAGKAYQSSTQGGIEKALAAAAK